MTFGNVLAVLVVLTLVYGAFAFIRTQYFHRSTFPFRY